MIEKASEVRIALGGQSIMLDGVHYTSKHYTDGSVECWRDGEPITLKEFVNCGASPSELAAVGQGEWNGKVYATIEDMQAAMAQYAKDHPEKAAAEKADYLKNYNALLDHFRRK